jgi:cell pole-organizing protein PopZ
MSNAAPQAGEPTMEEILASIRRIISEEEVDPALKPEGEAASAAAADDEVFELTDVVEPAAPPPPAPRVRPSLVEPVNDVAFAPEPEFEPEPVVAEADEGLVEPAAVDRAASAFAALARNVEIAATPGGNTLESMVQAMMKPMLKQWLNDHLPALVENIVREEVERVANRRR